MAFNCYLDPEHEEASHPRAKVNILILLQILPSITMFTKRKGEKQQQNLL